MSYSSVILATSGLQSYWRLGETTGNFADSKGSIVGTPGGGSTGSPLIRGAPGALPPGQDDGSVGEEVGPIITSGTLFSCGNNYGFAGSAAFSLEAFYKALFSGSNNGIEVTIGKGVPFVFVDGWFVKVSRNTATSTVINFQRIVSSSASIANSVIPTSNTFHHVVVTYDGSDMKVFVNGSLVATTSSSLSLASTTTNFTGHFLGNPTASGFLDEVSVYNRALTAAEVLEHYNASQSVLTSDAAGSAAGTSVCTATGANISPNVFQSSVAVANGSATAQATSAASTTTSATASAAGTSTAAATGTNAGSAQISAVGVAQGTGTANAVTQSPQPSAAQPSVGLSQGAGSASAASVAIDPVCITEATPQYLTTTLNTPAGPLSESYAMKTASTANSQATRINFDLTNHSHYFDPETSLTATNQTTNAPGSLFGFGWLQDAAPLMEPYQQKAGNYSFTFRVSITGALTTFDGTLTAILSRVNSTGVYREEIGRGTAAVHLVAGENTEEDVVVITALATNYDLGDRKYLELHLLAGSLETDTVKLETGNQSRMTASPQICPIQNSIGTAAGSALASATGTNAPQTITQGAGNAAGTAFVSGTGTNTTRTFASAIGLTQGTATANAASAAAESVGRGSASGMSLVFATGFSFPLLDTSGAGVASGTGDARGISTLATLETVGMSAGTAQAIATGTLVQSVQTNQPIRWLSVGRMDSL